MSLRAIFVSVVILGALPFILFRPSIGIMLWAWLGFMNPHRLAWGFAQTFPFAEVVALTTFIGMLLTGRWRFPPLTKDTVVLVFFCLWMQVTTVLALNQEEAWEQLEKVIKIQLMIFVTMMVIRTHDQLRALIWVVVASVSFYGMKGGVFTILRGGEERVLGPAGSFIEGNNEIGLALIMIIPLVRYLQLTTPYKWLHRSLLAAIVLCSVSVIGTHSRGALLGIVASLGFMLWKSKHRLGLAVLVGLMSPVALGIMPAKWYDRMGTIRHYDEDGSAMGRIYSWTFAIRLASDRPVVGGGFESFRPEVFGRYGLDPERSADAHSIYFEVLGEHGFVGLLLFLTLGLSAWSTCSWTIRRSRDEPHVAGLEHLARMVQVSFAGYAVAGAFLGLAYFDLYYTLIAFAVIARTLVARQQASHDFAAPVRRRGRLAPQRLERLS